MRETRTWSRWSADEPWGGCLESWGERGTSSPPREAWGDEGASTDHALEDFRHSPSPHAPWGSCGLLLPSAAHRHCPPPSSSSIHSPTAPTPGLVLSISILHYKCELCPRYGVNCAFPLKLSRLKNSSELVFIFSYQRGPMAPVAFGTLPPAAVIGRTPYLPGPAPPHRPLTPPHRPLTPPGEGKGALGSQIPCRGRGVAQTLSVEERICASSVWGKEEGWGKCPHPFIFFSAQIKKKKLVMREAAEGED